MDNIADFGQLGFSFAVTGYLLIRMESSIKELTKAVQALATREDKQ